MSEPYELPLLDSEELSNRDEATRQAYSSILSHKQWAAAAFKYRKDRERRFTCARVLGRLLLEAPSTRARNNIIEEVNACQDDNDRLYKLGEMYLEHYICLCESLSLFFSHSDR